MEFKAFPDSLSWGVSNSPSSVRISHQRELASCTDKSPAEPWPERVSKAVPTCSARTMTRRSPNINEAGLGQRLRASRPLSLYLRDNRTPDNACRGPIPRPSIFGDSKIAIFGEIDVTSAQNFGRFRGFRGSNPQKSRNSRNWKVRPSGE